MCVCVKTSENLSFCMSGITQPIKLKFGVHLKQARPFLSYLFRQNWFMNRDFIKKISNNVCNRSSRRKFWVIELNSSLQRDQCSRTFGIEFGKIPSKPSDFMKFWIFRKKNDFAQSSATEFKVLCYCKSRVVWFLNLAEIGEDFPFVRDFESFVKLTLSHHQLYGIFLDWTGILYTNEINGDL